MKSIALLFTASGTALPAGRQRNARPTGKKVEAPSGKRAQATLAAILALLLGLAPVHLEATPAAGVPEMNADYVDRTPESTAGCDSYSYHVVTSGGGSRLRVGLDLVLDYRADGSIHPNADVGRSRHAVPALFTRFLAGDEKATKRPSGTGADHMGP